MPRTCSSGADTGWRGTSSSCAATWRHRSSRASRRATCGSRCTGRELSEATRLASNDAFRDHWGSQSQNQEVWEKHRSVSISRDDLSFVAIGTNAAGEEEVAGYVITVVQPDDFEGQGFSSSYVELVGTRREWRGKGIAPALLTRVLEASKADGLDKVVLDVDAENPTGALGLYTSLGFEESNRTVSYVREF